MKYLLSVLALLIPSVSSAQFGGGAVGVYPDLTTAYCSIHDVPGPRTFYVVHRITFGSIGSRFRIEHSSGFTGTLLSSSSPFANVSGDPMTGVTVIYDGTCQPGNFHILTVNYMLYGGSPDCSWVRTAAHSESTSGSVEVWDCNFQLLTADWEGTHVDPGYGGPECPNDIDYEEHTHFCCPYSEPVLSTRSATWGAVKALYR